jgi:hypothetical protein
MTSHTNEELRQKMRKLIARCEVDPEFAQRAKADPAAVLREAGLPEDLVGPERKQYDWAMCTDFTCIVTGCPDTCYLSLVEE